MNFLFAFVLTIFAGMATLIGFFFIFIKKKNSEKILGISLSFSSGVMLYASLTEIFIKGRNLICNSNLSNKKIYFISTLWLFIGILFAYLIDIVVGKINHKNNDIYRVGIISMVILSVHNFPEGLMTFTSALVSNNIGYSVFIASLLHNIPEGFSISMPIYHATKSTKKAFILTFITAVAEPIGAIFFYLLIYNYINDLLIGSIFCFVSGIMTYIVISELIPTSFKYLSKKFSMLFIILGMLVMAISLVLFA